MVICLRKDVVCSSSNTKSLVVYVTTRRKTPAQTHIQGWGCNSEPWPDSIPSTEKKKKNKKPKSPLLKVHFWNSVDVGDGLLIPE